MEKPLRLRIGTLNTWAKPRFDEIARWAADRRLDLLTLQEVDRNWSERTGWADVAAEIAKRLDWHYAYAPAIKITEKTRMIPTIARAIQPGGEKQAPPHEVQEEQPQQELPPQATWIA